MLSLRNVAAGYKKNEEIIKKINITFKKGTITSIIGRNGCGKTTLLRTAANLLKPSTGEVMLDCVTGRRNLYTMKSSHVAQRISFLPQSKDVPNITVYNLVMHGRFPYLNFARIPQKKDRLAVREALRMTGIEHLEDRYVPELSGGQRQKVYIAMVLAQDTDILFFDEPTTYLDLNYRFEILEIIKGLSNIGKTIVMVLHDLDSALSISDKICLMDGGGILLCDTPAAVVESKLISRVFNVNCRELYLEEGNQRHYYFTLLRQ